MGVSGGYVVVAGSSAEAPNDISVLKLTTGARVWYNSAGNCGYGTALVVAQRVISGGCGTALTARNLATGAVIWSRSKAWRLWRGDTDALAGRHIYATNASGSVVSLNPLTGKTQYSLAGAANVLAVAGARVFAACGRSGVCAYSLTSGSRQWNTRSGSGTRLASSAGGVLYLDHGLALNTGTGTTMATVWAASRQATGLAVGDGRIAAVSGNGQVLDLYGLPGY
jgi:outer membrane protein assembly factor BamB